ncbi:pentapeptide repeat-containing protein [Chloroflexota bacterium]
MDFQKESYFREQLSRLSLTGETVQSVVFEECEFNNCSFIGCKFEKCRFFQCKFNECDLSNVLPMNSEFIEVSFSKCKAIGVDWTKATRIKELDFSECLINYSNFRMMKLPGISMTKCEAKEIDFIETDLSKGTFRGTDFEKSVFFKTNLTKADFSRAINYTIDTKTNLLKKTRFSLPEAMALLDTLDIIIE